MWHHQLTIVYCASPRAMWHCDTFLAAVIAWGLTCNMGSWFSQLILAGATLGLLSFHVRPTFV